jgi:hypothetical protein
VKREGIRITSGAAVALDKATEFGTPLNGQISDTQIEYFVLGVIATRNALTCKKLMEAPEVGTKDLGPTLTWNLVDSIKHCL